MTDEQPASEWELVDRPDALGDGGRWLSLQDAAEALDVSVDTIRRRMKREEILAKQEQRPQGFRWLVFVDHDQREATGTVAAERTGASAESNADRTSTDPALAGVDDSTATEPIRTTATATSTDGAPILTVLSDRDELIRELRNQLASRDRDLDVREREAAELRAIIARQASALEHATRLQALAATASPVAPASTPAGPDLAEAAPSPSLAQAPAVASNDQEPPAATTARPVGPAEPMSWWRRLWGG